MLPIQAPTNNQPQPQPKALAKPCLQTNKHLQEIHPQIKS